MAITSTFFTKLQKEDNVPNTFESYGDAGSLNSKSKRSGRGPLDSNRDNNLAF